MSRKNALQAHARYCHMRCCAHTGAKSYRTTAMWCNAVTLDVSHILQRQLHTALGQQLDCSLSTYLILCMSISSGLVWPRSIAFRSAGVSLKICPLLLSTSSRTDDAVATMCCILTPNCSRVAEAIGVALADGRYMMADVPGCYAVDVPCLKPPWVTSNCVCWQ